MEPEVLPDIAPDDYRDFRSLNPGSFPTSENWYADIKSKRQEAEARGRKVVMISVKVDGFKSYCAEHGQRRDPQTLWRYAKTLHSATPVLADASSVKDDPLGLWRQKDDQ